MLDLFSGIGGFSLAAQWCWGNDLEIVAFCEIDKFCQKVLKKHWPNVPLIEDVRDAKDFDSINLLTAGAPCQPFSKVGPRKGKQDNRYLWREMFSVISETKSDWLVFENVPEIDGMVLDEWIIDLETQNYEVAPPFKIPACAVNSPQERYRLWLVAYSKSIRYEHGKGSFKERTNGQPCIGGSLLCDSTSERLPDWTGGKMEQPKTITEFERPSGREIECNFRGMAYGISRRVDRLKSLGNAIVPQIAFQIFRTIKEIGNGKMPCL